MLNKIISTTIGACISMFGLIPNIFKPSLSVTTSEQALFIGSQVARNKYPNIDYNRYLVNVDDSYLDSHNIWVVSYLLLEEDGRIADVLGGGGPVIHISKTDGKIVYINLQR